MNKENTSNTRRPTLRRCDVTSRSTRARLFSRWLLHLPPLCATHNTEKLDTPSPAGLKSHDLRPSRDLKKWLVSRPALVDLQGGDLTPAIMLAAAEQPLTSSDLLRVGLVGWVVLHQLAPAAQRFQVGSLGVAPPALKPLREIVPKDMMMVLAKIADPPADLHWARPSGAGHALLRGLVGSPTKRLPADLH